MSDDDHPFYSPTLKPLPPRVARPGEKLFEFLVGHDRYLFELRDHGETYGVECQIFKNEELPVLASVRSALGRIATISRAGDGVGRGGAESPGAIEFESRSLGDAKMNNVKVTRPCPVAGCKGTMYFHDRREPADAPHTLEWPWYATWVCAENPAHFQLVTDAEYREHRGDPYSDLPH
jgi:hypothetical protein